MNAAPASQELRPPITVPEIYFSSGAFSGMSLEEMLDECERHGRAGLELSSGIRHDERLDERLAAAAPRSVPLLVHNYFPPPAKPFVLNLAATDPAIRNASLDLCRRGIELGATLGAPFYSVHSGFAMNLTPAQLGQPDQQAALPQNLVIDRDLALENFSAAVAKLAEFASQRGVGLLIENNVITAQQIAAGRADSLLMTRPEELCAFFDHPPHANVKLLLDVGHANVTAGAFRIPPETFFGEVGHKIGALHLSENDGRTDTNRAFSEDAWFAPFLHDHAGKPMVIEVYRTTVEERARLYATAAAMLA